MTDIPEKTDQALSDKARLGVTEAEWNWAMERVFAMQANGSKAGAAILLIEAVRQEREACLWLCEEFRDDYLVQARGGDNSGASDHRADAADSIADAIRSRSSATGEKG